MPDLQSDPSNADEFAQDGTGLRDMSRISLDIGSPTPLKLNGLTSDPSDTAEAQTGGGYSFEPITDLALDRHYANLAQQHDPDATPGVLGMFQKLPSDGISDRWRYTPPNIPGAPMTDDYGNPCAAWIVTRPIGNTLYTADHNFVVVADKPGGPIRARFSYGPSMREGGQLVSATGSHNDTDNGDLAAWGASTNPLSGIRMEPIPAGDAAVIAAGHSLDSYLGTPSHPGAVPYFAVPEIWPSNYANSNTAAAGVANEAISRNPSPLNRARLDPYPGSLSPGWYRQVPGWKPW